MNQLRTPLTALAVAFGLCAGSAIAKEPTPEEVKAYQTALFKQLDENGDGKITEKEFVVSVLYAVFVDEAGKDGKLTKAEYFKNSTEKTAKQEWALMDPDGKGTITFKDVFKNTVALDDLKGEFKKFDKGGRGHVTMNDLN